MAALSEPCAQSAAPHAGLRIDALTLFGILFAAHLLFGTIYEAGELEFWRGVPIDFHLIERATLALAAFAFLLRPNSLPLLITMVLARLIDYLANVPVASNNATISAFTTLALLSAAGYIVLKDHRLTRERTLRAFAPMARDLLIVMYFYGVFHKINSDFLNPAVSCAVAVYRPLASPFALADWKFGQYGAIYATFIIETLAIICLLSRRWKYYGLALGMPFHIVIGLSGYAFYMDFSTLCLSLYALFLPESYFDRLNAALERGLRRLDGLISRRVIRLILLALPAALVIESLLIRRLLGSVPFMPQHAMPAFVLISVPYYLSVLLFCPLRPAESAWMPSFGYLSPGFALLSLLFLLNGMSPYIGFKTESSVAMFSNLRTEGGHTNHLLVPRLPYLFHYQSDIVAIDSSSSPDLRRYAGPQYRLVKYELDRVLANDPHAQVRFERSGTVADHVDQRDNSFLSTNWLFRQLLIFKPIDLTEPHPCTH